MQATNSTSPSSRKPPRPKPRRGIVVVLTGFLLVGIFAFVSLSVDTGRIALTETEMQNAVDAAALAASAEIAASIQAASQGNGPIDVGAAAVAAARQVAVEVAAANGVFVDGGKDVAFGARRYDEATGSWPIEWGAEPFNVVRVDARRNGSDISAPDGELPLAFGFAVGRSSVALRTSATAFVEARDLVVVMDFSGSMSDDSELKAIGDFPQTQVEAGLDQIYSELQEADLTWPDQPDRPKFLDAYGEIEGPVGQYYSTNNIIKLYQLLDVDEFYPSNHPQWPGQPVYPFPQSGRFSDGTPRGMLTAQQNANRWKDYIKYVRDLNGPYRKRYGLRTLVDYLLQNNQMNWDESEDLWRTSHYPFHAVKEGTTLFLGFLKDLDFGDQVGMVSYGTYAVTEDSHYDGEVDIDISSDPITDDYASLDEIQRRHQAGHYDVFTGIGDGVLEARELLVGDADNASDQGHSRFGARPTIILMTDGRANRSPNGFNLPGDFRWSDYTDYDGDGSADYSSNDDDVEYAFYEAVEAIKRGITIHTLGVGSGADRELMRAIAFAGGGIFIDVPGGTQIEEIEEQMLEAFGLIAARVPPPQLVLEVSTAAE